MCVFSVLRVLAYGFVGLKTGIHLRAEPITVATIEFELANHGIGGTLAGDSIGWKFTRST